MPTEAQPGADPAPNAASPIAHLRMFTGAVATIAGIVGTSLLRVLVPAWLGSAAAFVAVAAAVVTLVRLPDAIGPAALYSVYVMLGLASGTLLALALAVERSVPRLQQYLDVLAGRLLQTLVRDIARERDVSPGDLAARLQSVLGAFASRTAGLRRFTPVGALLRVLVRGLSPELATLSGVSSSMLLEPGGVTVQSISAHAATTAGAQLSARARQGRILAIAVWIVVFVLSATPLFLFGAGGPR